MTTKRYDRAYFDHWYRGRNRVSSRDEVRRKVALAVAACEYFIRHPLRSVLDVGCGEGYVGEELCARGVKEAWGVDIVGDRKSVV